VHGCNLLPSDTRPRPPLILAPVFSPLFPCSHALLDTPADSDLFAPALSLFLSISHALSPFTLPPTLSLSLSRLLSFSASLASR